MTKKAASTTPLGKWLFAILLPAIVLCYAAYAELALPWVSHRRNVMADAATNSASITFMIRVPAGEQAEAISFTVWRTPPDDTVEEGYPISRSDWTVFPDDYGPWIRVLRLRTARYTIRADRWLNGRWKKVYENILIVHRVQ